MALSKYMALNTKDVVLIALFTALLAATGHIPTLDVIPLVPITIQSLFVMLAGGVLGAKRGALSMALFVLLVAVGLPMAAKAVGGLGLFGTPRGGFLVGFIPAAFVIGFLVERFWHKLTYLIAFICCVIGGIIVLYLPAIPWWLAVTEGFTLSQVLLSMSVFLPGDFVKAIIAAFVIVQVKKSYPLIKPD